MVANHHLAKQLDEWQPRRLHARCTAQQLVAAQFVRQDKDALWEDKINWARDVGTA